MNSHRWINLVVVAFSVIILNLSCKDKSTNPANSNASSVMDHSSGNIDAIPALYIDNARNTLRIAYGHTSHGSQLISGMQGLIAFKGTKYRFNATGADSALQLRDTPFAGAYDLGSPDLTAWAGATRTYLAANPTINVVMWSWCGQVSTASVANIEQYLLQMSALERDYPGVRFVYMTGHLDGTGHAGNLHQRNEQIRAYCRTNNKILYDFADIESFDPDGKYYADKNANDNCDYDSDGNGSLDRNWAIEWQNAHPGDWYDCSAAHSQALNGNRKAYAAWALFARLAGWSGN